MIKEGNWYLYGEDKLVPNKFFKLSTFVKQKKKKGQIVFVYESTDEAEKVLLKSSPKRAKVRIREFEQGEKYEDDEDTVDILKANTSRVKARKIKFIDDKTVGTEKSERFAIARAKRKPAPKEVSVRCYICGKDFKISPKEASARGDMFYRCNRCCGG